MITDLVIVDDALKDPHRLVNLAKQQEYFTLDTHELTMPNIKWAGHRSKLIHEMDQQLLNEVVLELIGSVMKKTLGECTMPYEFNSSVSACFHYLTQDDKFNSSWYHTDNNTCFAGILYLNEDMPQTPCGTYVITDEDEIEVENKFNRFVMYRADYFHAARGGFGHDVNDSRLTANFFFHGIELRMDRQ